MILNGFRKANIRKSINKELLKRKELRIENTNNIALVVLFVDEDSLENLDQIISKKLNIDAAKVSIVFFRTKQGSETSYENELTEKDFSLFGKLKNESIKKLINSDCDLLLNYTNDNLHLNYLTAFSKARFKVGLKDNQKELFDLMINVDNSNLDLFHNELVKYLKILNKI